jgi:hypothetical protein
VQKQAVIIATFYLLGAALIAMLFLWGHGQLGSDGAHSAAPFCR